MYEVVSLSELYLHVRMSETAVTFAQLIEGVASYMKSQPPSLSSPPKVGCVYFVDGSWCRVEVLAMFFYLDYGNTGGVYIRNGGLPIWALLQ